MNWKNEIEEYVPINEQEEKDKEIILEYIDRFKDVLTRKNEMAHITSSAFVVNKSRDKALMIHHNIYNTWAWTGGHVDGDEDFLQVAIRELKEETGIGNCCPISYKIESIDILPVIGHFKKGKYVSAHLHLSLAYVIEVEESEQLKIKVDENSGVRWIPINEIHTWSNEEHMIKVYDKLVNKVMSLL